MPKSYSLIAILLFGAILRLYGLTSISLWHDEAFSALLIRYPFQEMIWRISLDVHPAFYYLLLRIWDMALGDGLFSLRLFSSFFGILTVYFVYLFIRDSFKSERLALISAAFIALNPFQIQYATEARMYTLGTFLLVLSSWLLVKALETQGISEKETFRNACKASLKKCNWLIGLSDKKSPSNYIFVNLDTKINKYRWWILYGVSAALAIHTHYYLMFSVAAQAVFVILWGIIKYGRDISAWRQSQNIRGALISWLIALILFLPWLKVFINQLGQVEQNYWIPKMDNYSIPNTLWKMLASSNIYINNDLLIITAIIFLIIFAVAFKKEKNIYKYLIAASFLVPFALAIILSFKRSLYLDRYFVFTGIFYLMIFAIFINLIKKRFVGNILIAIFLIASIAFFARNWQNINPAGKPGMGKATAYLFENIAPKDKVYVNSSFVYFTYKYYAYQHYLNNINFNPSALVTLDSDGNKIPLYPLAVTPQLYTPGITDSNQIPHFSGAALLTNDDLLIDFNQNIERGGIIWLIWTTGFGSGKPDVPKNLIQLDEKGFEDVLGYRGWIYVTKYRVQ